MPFDCCLELLDIGLVLGDLQLDVIGSVVRLLDSLGIVGTLLLQGGLVHLHIFLQGEHLLRVRERRCRDRRRRHEERQQERQDTPSRTP